MDFWDVAMDSFSRADYQFTHFLRPFLIQNSQFLAAKLSKNRGYQAAPFLSLFSTFVFIFFLHVTFFSIFEARSGEKIGSVSKKKNEK